MYDLICPSMNPKLRQTKHLCLSPSSSKGARGLFLRSFWVMWKWLIFLPSPAEMLGFGIGSQFLHLCWQFPLTRELLYSINSLNFAFRIHNALWRFSETECALWQTLSLPFQSKVYYFCIWNAETHREKKALPYSGSPLKQPQWQEMGQPKASNQASLLSLSSGFMFPGAWVFLCPFSSP